MKTSGVDPMLLYTFTANNGYNLKSLLLSDQIIFIGNEMCVLKHQGFQIFGPKSNNKNSNFTLT